MKRQLSDLAILGGEPAFLRPLLVGRPNRVDRDRLFERLSWVLDNQWLTNGGPLVTEFQARVAAMVETRHCVAVCNGTSGLQLLARALNLTGEVVVPSLTFVATAHALQWLGLEPVFCDVDEQTGTIDVASAEAAITDRTSAIVGVHLWGRPCDVDGLERLAAQRGLELLLDAAHCVGCTAGGRPIGSRGRAEVFSFHATKVVNAFEGGAVVTDDEALADRLRRLANFGIGGEEGRAWGGTNAKMSEASAAMGLTSLDELKRVSAVNSRNYQRYREELGDVHEGLHLLPYPRGERSNHHYVIARVDEQVTGMSRDTLLKILYAENVSAKAYFSPPCHEMEPYRRTRPVRLPSSEALAREVLALPTGDSVASEDIRRVCDVIRLAVTRGHEISARCSEGVVTEAA